MRTIYYVTYDGKQIFDSPSVFEACGVFHGMTLHAELTGQKVEFHTMKTTGMVIDECIIDGHTITIFEKVVAPKICGE